MKTSLDCMECNVKQLIKVSKLLDVSKEKQEEASKELFRMLSNINFEYSNPYIMGKTWKILTRVYENDNPYKEIKHEYNQLLLSMYDQIKIYVEQSLSPLETALKISVVGNIIDFGARHKFDKKDVFERIENNDSIVFAKNDSSKLLRKLKTANTLLYIGDNCGEIVLDKLFIEQIKKWNPKIRIHFGVRGSTILNDVTIDDANEVRIEELATVVSSGNQIPGTIIEKTTKEFQELFHNSDIVIAKGQGNFESLSDTKRENLYLILMAKCEYVARIIGCNTMDYIVMENK